MMLPDSQPPWDEDIPQSPAMEEPEIPASQPEPEPFMQPGDLSSSGLMLPPPPPGPERLDHKTKVKARLEELRWGIWIWVVCSYSISACFGGMFTPEILFFLF